MASYILKWRGGAPIDRDDRETRIWLTGPFETDAAACKWARKDQSGDGDDPRWQLVHLHMGASATFYHVEIKSP